MASKLGTVIAALKETLETARTGTIYEPERVQEEQYWPNFGGLPDGIDTFYLIALGDVTQTDLDMCNVTRMAEVKLVAATRYKSVSDDPFRQDPLRADVARDLDADLGIKLRSDEKLAGSGDPEVIDIFFQQPTANLANYHDAWVIVTLDLAIKYRHGRAER